MVHLCAFAQSLLDGMLDNFDIVDKQRPATSRGKGPLWMPVFLPRASIDRSSRQAKVVRLVDVPFGPYDALQYQQ